MQADGSRALNTRQVYVRREGRGRCGPSTAGLPPAPEGAASEEQPLPGALIFPLLLNMSTPAVPRRSSKRDPSTAGLTEPRVPAPTLVWESSAGQHGAARLRHFQPRELSQSLGTFSHAGLASGALSVSRARPGPPPGWAGPT